MNLEEFEIIRKIKRSTAEICKYEKELAKQEKLSAENQLLARRLGLDKNAESQALRATEEAAASSMRSKIAEMKLAHNKFAIEHGYNGEVLPE